MIVLAAMAAAWSAAAQAGRCENLAMAGSPQVEIVMAHSVAAGTFTPPEAGAALLARWPYG